MAVRLLVKNTQIDDAENCCVKAAPATIESASRSRAPAELLIIGWIRFTPMRSQQQKSSLRLKTAIPVSWRSREMTHSLMARRPSITSCKLRSSVGSWCFFLAAATDGTLSLTVENPDYRDAPQRILKSVAPDGWKTIARLIATLEYSGIVSVAERPLRIVDRFGEKWMLG